MESGSLQSVAPSQRKEIKINQEVFGKEEEFHTCRVRISLHSALSARRHFRSQHEGCRFTSCKTGAHGAGVQNVVERSLVSKVPLTELFRSSHTGVHAPAATGVERLI